MNSHCSADHETLQPLETTTTVDAVREGCSIEAKNISGCGRQLRDALIFLPIMILSIIVGLGLMILSFWLANWNPSLIRGIWAILTFAAVPATTFVIWSRWAFRPGSADTLLTIQDDDLIIERLRPPMQTRAVPWQRITNCRKRQVVAGSYSLRIATSGLSLHDPARVEQLIFCASPARRCVFLTRLEHLLQRRL